MVPMGSTIENEEEQTMKRASFLFVLASLSVAALIACGDKGAQTANDMTNSASSASTSAASGMSSASNNATTTANSAASSASSAAPKH